MSEKVGIVANLVKPEALRVAERIADFLDRRGVGFYLEEGLAHELRRPELASQLSDMLGRVGLLVVVGGDGTVLRTCLNLPEDAPPIMAVNVGRRGFLTTVEPAEVEEALDAFLSGRAVVEERMRLETTIDGHPVPRALNEVCLTCRTPVKLFRAEVRRDGTLAYSVEGDGLIVATPTGSTAYSLSCGGPVVDPGLRCILVTPICPIRPSWSLVLPPEAEVEVEVLGAREPVLVVDGQAIFDLRPGSHVRVRASDEPLRFVGLSSKFYEKLLGRGRRPHEG